MDLKRLTAHWQDEGESAYLYKILASLEKNERRQRIFTQLAEVELRHQRTFLKMITDRGAQVGEWKPGLRTRFLGWLAKRGNESAVLSLRISDEAREVRGYLGETRATTEDDVVKNQRSIAREEAHHAEVLTELAGHGHEPWHQSNSGGFLRNVIYGFNDGLTANFGLVMGVIGAEVQSTVVLLTGLSGLVADALSMGGSGFLAAKSEQEVWENEIAMEREEIELMPEVEQQQGRRPPSAPLSPCCPSHSGLQRPSSGYRLRSVCFRTSSSAPPEASSRVAGLFAAVLTCSSSDSGSPASAISSACSSPGASNSSNIESRRGRRGTPGRSRGTVLTYQRW